MNRLSAAWPLALGSLRRARGRWLLTAALLGLAIASYLVYTTFMMAANAGAATVIAPARLPADLVFTGDRPLADEVVADWRRHAGVVTVATARLTAYHTAAGTLNVFALPADSPLWQAAGVVSVPGRGEILLPAALLTGETTLGAEFSLIPPRAQGGRQDLVVAGAHGAADLIFEDAGLIVALQHGPLPDCMFFWTAGPGATNSLAASLEVEYGQPGRPLLRTIASPAAIHTGSAEGLAAGILAQTYMPGFGILTMVLLFAGIGLFTVSSLAFLDRKRELAILKTVGLESQGVVDLFLLEQGIVALAGIFFGILLAMAVLPRVTAALPASQGLAWSSVVRAVIAGLVVQAAGVAVPALTARVATVNQLLYNLPIPLYARRIYRSEV